jgi:hypothetical protein
MMVRMDKDHSTSAGQSAGRRQSFIGWLKKNPAVGGSVLYLWVSIIGSSYEWSLLRHFGINVFDFANTGDFLLAAFKQPLVLGAGIGVVGLAVGWDIAKKWLEALPKAHDHRGIPRYVVTFVNLNSFLTWWLVVPAYALLPGFLFAQNEAKRVLAGHGDHVYVELTRGDSLITLPDSSTALLGTTSEFLFLYRRDTKRTYVAPRSSLAQLRLCEPPSSSQKDSVATCPP